MVKVIKAEKIPYVIIKVTVLNDARLSWKAKGLFAYLFSQADNWQYYQSEVVNHSTDGMASLRKGLKELETYGYIERSRTRDEHGHLKDTKWILNGTPDKSTFPPKCENQTLENRMLENRMLENRTLTNINQNNYQPEQLLTKTNEQALHCNTQVTNRNTEKDKELDKDIEQEKPLPAKAGASVLNDFEKLWKLYPRKQGKKDALAAYKRAIKKGTTNKEIQDGIVAYVAYLKQTNTKKQYVKQGDTWFRKESWTDKYDTAVSKAKGNVYQDETLDQTEARLAAGEPF